MEPILSIATSGMLAAATRLQVSAENVANAQSDGPLPSADPPTAAQYPSAYGPKQVNQIATAGGGTKAVVTNARPATVPAYAPTAPYADANGEVAAPNVDYVHEALQQATASYTFAMNAAVARAYARMMKSLLDIKT
jgi:flagellar basal-body rod protein FlgC